MKYWFKPKKFWKCFAFYYPSSKEGWTATVTLLSIGVILFYYADLNSHSGSDTLISFAPWAITLMTIFDLLCFRFGLYPSWWTKKERK